MRIYLTLFTHLNTLVKIILKLWYIESTSSKSLVKSRLSLSVTSHRISFSMLLRALFMQHFFFKKLIKELNAFTAEL